MVESSVQAKTGSSFIGMTFLRLTMSFVIAAALNLVLPREGWARVGTSRSADACDSLAEVFRLWLGSSMQVILSILLIVTLPFATRRHDYLCSDRYPGPMDHRHAAFLCRRGGMELQRI